MSGQEKFQVILHGPRKHSHPIPHLTENCFVCTSKSFVFATPLPPGISVDSLWGRCGYIFFLELHIPRWWMFDRDWLIREVILIVNCKCLTHTVFWLLYFVVHQRVVSLCFQSHTILLIQPNTKPESQMYSDYETKDECMEGNTDYKVGLTGLWD